MIRSIKGVKDILPDQASRWSIIESTAHKLAQQFGFSEIRIPIFEHTELYARSIGESTDVVEKEMYTFQDRDGSSLTLRPEGTAGVVRAFIEHNLISQFSMRKLYYIGPMFRHERPQAGRFRQFHQLGVEAFGSDDPMMDVEVISLLWEYFNTLNLPDLTLYINSIGSIDDRKDYISHLRESIEPQIQHFCQNCQRRIHTNPLRILDCKVETCQKLSESVPLLTDHLSSSSSAHFQQVLNGLTTLNIPYTIQHRLVRGLDYYSQTTFEITSSGLGAQNTIGAGGRYDGLVKTLGGPATPAVGFAVGLERVNLLLPSSSVPSPPSLLFIAGFGELGRPTGFQLLHTLRKRGLIADTDYRAQTLKAHLRSADRLNAMASIILGDDEIKNDTLIVRNMQSKQQIEIPISQAPDKLCEWQMKGEDIF